jgi:hypothetical protein
MKPGHATDLTKEKYRPSMPNGTGAKFLMNTRNYPSATSERTLRTCVSGLGGVGKLSFFLESSYEKYPSVSSDGPTSKYPSARSDRRKHERL